MSQKSFILFQEYKNNFSLLSQNQKGDLIDAIFAYNEGQEIKLEPIVSMAFSFIKNDLDRNKISWENKKEERSISGRLGNLKRWNQDLHHKVSTGGLSLEEAEQIAKMRKLSLSDNSDSQKSQDIANIAVNVNVNKNVNGNVNVNKKEESENFQIFWKKYDYKKSKSKAEASFKTALKKESFENIIAGLENYIKNLGTDPKFWKHPTTWLNSGSWSDEYKTKKDNHNNFKTQDYNKGTEGFNVY